MNCSALGTPGSSRRSLILCNPPQLLLIAALVSTAHHAALGESGNPDCRMSYGIFPYLAATLVRADSDLVVGKLEHDLNCKVDVFVPPTLQTTIEESLRDQFDLLVVPPHVAAVLISARGYRAVASTGWRLKPTIYTLKKSGINSLAELSGRSLATPGPISIATLLTQQMLVESKMGAGSVELIDLSNHNEVLLQLISGQVDAVASLPSVIEYLQPSLKARVSVVHELEAIPAAIFLTRHDVPLPREAKIRTVLFEKMPAQLRGQPSYRALSLEDREGMELLEPIARAQFEKHGIEIESR